MTHNLVCKFCFGGDLHHRVGGLANSFELEMRILLTTNFKEKTSSLEYVCSLWLKLAPSRPSPQPSQAGIR